MAALAAIGKGLHWLVSIPQRRSLSTVEALKTLIEGKDNLHSQELRFRDLMISEKDREIADLKMRLKVPGPSATMTQD